MKVGKTTGKVMLGVLVAFPWVLFILFLKWVF